jgi:predicted DCC family thiol-disulfide oxidoreductase YuxK
MPTTLVLYDADCGFCRWSLGKLLAWDRREALRPVALQDPEAGRLLAHMDEEERMASWHLVTQDGAVRSGGAALAPLLRLLPGGRPAAALAERVPRLVDRAYRFVAGHRTVFGRPVSAGAKRRADRRIDERAASGELHPAP